MNEQSKDVSTGSTELATRPNNDINTNLSCLNLYSEDGLAKAKLFLTQFISSEKGGVKSIADGVAIMARAQDLQLPFTTCCEHIHVINHKTGVDVHIIKALLLRAGVSWERIKDYTPLYNYTDGSNVYLETQLPDYCVKCRNAADADKVTNESQVGVYPLPYYRDMKGNIYDEFQISDKCTKVFNQAHANKVLKEGGFPVIRIPARPIDYITEFKFTRDKGKPTEWFVTSRFTYSEAVTAGFFEKDTYIKYARIMIDHRAFTLGARDIADDLIMGCMESSELGIINDDTTLITPEYVEID